MLKSLIWLIRSIYVYLVPNTKKALTEHTVKIKVFTCLCIMNMFCIFYLNLFVVYLLIIDLI